MSRKTKLRVGGMELEFASLNFADIGKRVAKSNECEQRGYHIPVEPRQEKYMKVGDYEEAIALCRYCGVWTLASRFRETGEDSR